MSLLKPKGLPWSTVARLAAPWRIAGLCRERPPWRSERNATEGVPYSAPLRVFICVADHYDPKRARPSREIERQRVDRWMEGYPRSVAGLADSAGRAPQHTFFYPAEEYEPEHLDRLAELCQAGYGEVEVHLHHDNDTSERLRETLLTFTSALYERHGLLAKDAEGKIRYGFIHGNWALDNSRKDGRWCGVNDELTVLAETGCYADFTMPSAPADCQTRTINSIYYARDDCQRPKSHDRGVPARVGGRPPADGLLMIQGPLALNWRRRKWGVLPRLENGDLHGGHPPDEQRLRLWLRAGVGVVGRPEWRFVKLHTHGAQERNAAMLLGEPMRRFHESLAELARRQADFRYYYVTAREMADLVRQAEAGATEPRVVRPDFSRSRLLAAAEGKLC
jgi:hypothetical protein